MSVGVVLEEIIDAWGTRDVETVAQGGDVAV